ncbi:MAG: bifunctional adenosylcobinamide kinase/adenosylcobinamide-phosphate guanylyltransferase [Desulfosarcina sp.]|nr:bifunctional adenosylcobinamide kinase/adenosylcobinamide-phosphate guanylyltransferase [Desulfobacterales bacterium]
MADISLTIGPRSCGKSEFVENNILKYKKKLYVGTLWNDNKFHSLLQRHRLRRDESWILYEVQGNIRKDYTKIDTILSMHEKRISPIPCLIDGLTTWALHCAMKNRSVAVSAYNVAYFLSQLIFEHPWCIWHLVDVTPQTFRKKNQKEIFEACKNIHFLLKKNIENLIVYNW